MYFSNDLKECFIVFDINTYFHENKSSNSQTKKTIMLCKLLSMNVSKDFKLF